MRISVLFSICLLLFGRQAYCQTAQPPSPQPTAAFECCRSRDRAIAVIPRLYTVGDDDSLNLVLADWEDRCGADGYRTAFILLRDIRTRSFESRSYNRSSIAAALLEFHQACVSASPYPIDTGGSCFGHNDILYRQFIARLADAVRLIPDLSPLEQFVVLYLRDPDATGLSPVYGPVFDQRVRYSEPSTVRRFFDLENVAFGVLAGKWIPTGGLAALGTHPYVGLIIDNAGRRVSAGMSVAFSFLPLGQQVRVRAEDSVFSSSRFLCGMLSFDGGIAPLSTKRHRIDIRCGIGADWMDLLSVSRPGSDRVITKSLSSLDLNAGIGYRMRITARTRVGVQAKYHLVDFDNQGGTDLRGNFFTAGLALSLFAN